MYNYTKMNKSTAVKNQLPLIPVFLPHSALKVCPARVLLPVGKMILKMPTVLNLAYLYMWIKHYILLPLS